MLGGAVVGGERGLDPFTDLDPPASSELLKSGDGRAAAYSDRLFKRWGRAAMSVTGGAHDMRGLIRLWSHNIGS